jgi:acyl carrier protein
MNDEVREKLASCFRIVFPALPRDAVYMADQKALPAWDSVGAISLVNVIEEEFGILMDFEMLPQLTSFERVLDYVKSAVQT